MLRTLRLVLLVVGVTLAALGLGSCAQRTGSYSVDGRDVELDVERKLWGDDPLVVRPKGTESSMLLTHEILVQWVDGATEEQIAEVLARLELTFLSRSDYVPGLWVVGAPDLSPKKALEACRLLGEEPLVEYVEPNFVQDSEYQSTGDEDTGDEVAAPPPAPAAPDDEYFPRQWHLDNTGQGGGTPDADIDALEAWTISRGDKDVVIAVFDNGFEVEHPDLAVNLWSLSTDPGVHGRDFQDDDDTLEGDPAQAGRASHGTSAAGCAAARGNNGLGVSGSCPECSLMLIRRKDPASGKSDAEAVSWALQNGAQVLSNSWAFRQGIQFPTALRKALESAATEGRDGKGAVILFAARNSRTPTCEITDITSLDCVITVGSVSNCDSRPRRGGEGDCIDVLGPSRNTVANQPDDGEGTLCVTTTDRMGMDTGYNADPELVIRDQDDKVVFEDIPTDGDYTACFGGNSAATPIVAGVVGLILSAAPDITAVQVKHLLRDTADRVDDATGEYALENGRSITGKNGSGRVNAFEAVRLVAPVESGGYGGVDVFLRDHRLDWGNTEQPTSVFLEPQRGTIAPWQSPDIKVDAPPFLDATPDAFAFDAFASETPEAGQPIRVYVRVRNRGPRAAHDVSVHLLATAAATSLPALPAGFPTNAPAIDDAWRLLGTAVVPELEYSGSSTAGGAGDHAAVLMFEDAGATADAAGDTTGDTDASAPPLAYLAVVDCADDRFTSVGSDPDLPGDLVPTENNVTCRAVFTRPVEAASTSASTTWTTPVVLRNPHTEAVSCRLEVVGGEGKEITFGGAGAALDGFAVDTPFELPGGAEYALTVTVGPDAGESVDIADAQGTEGAESPAPVVSETVELRQWSVRPDGDRLEGGLVLRLPGAVAVESADEG